MALVRVQKAGMAHFVRAVYVPTTCLAKSAIAHANVTKTIPEAVIRGLESAIVWLAGAATHVTDRARSSGMVKIVPTNAIAMERNVHQPAVIAFADRAIKAIIARNNVRMVSSETVRKNVTVRMANVTRKLANVSAPWDGKVRH